MQRSSQTEFIDRLLAQRDDDKARIQTLRLRIAFLEQRLEQRSEKTKKDLKKLMPYFKTMRKKIMKIFVDMPTSVGLTHQEIIEEFRSRFPKVNTAHVPRRVCELVSDERKLWSKTDEKGKVRFYLRLKDLKDGEKSG